MASGEIFPSDFIFILFSYFPEERFVYNERIIHETLHKLSLEEPRFFEDRCIRFETDNGYPKSLEIERALGQMKKWMYLHVLNHGNNAFHINHSDISKDHASLLRRYFLPGEVEKIKVFSEKLQEKLEVKAMAKID